MARFGFGNKLGSEDISEGKLANGKALSGGGGGFQTVYRPRHEFDIELVELFRGAEQSFAVSTVFFNIALRHKHSHGGNHSGECLQAVVQSFVGR